MTEEQEEHLHESSSRQIAELEPTLAAVDVTDVDNTSNRSDDDEGELYGGEENSIEGDTSSGEIHEVFSSASHETLQFKSEYYRFPILHDPGLEEAFAYREDPPKNYDDDGQELFKDAMREDDLTLIHRFHDGLKKRKIDLQFSRLDPRAMLPMRKALAKNKTVSEINFRENHLTTDAAFHLSEILIQNKAITWLNLSGCNLGREGICKLGDALEFSTTLHHLDLSKNELGDAGLECLINGIGYNTSIKYLNLSHNKLTHLSGPYLTDIFDINSSITTLDLSWNDIAQETGLRKMLFSIAKLNETLENLIMQWNGLAGETTASYFRTFLARHKYIQQLDLSHNRFQGNGVMEMFYKGINSSESLVMFNLSFNPLTIDNVTRIILGISTNSFLKNLKLADLWMRQEDYEVAREKFRGHLFVEIEGTRGIKKDIVSESTIQELLLKRCHYLGLKPKKKAKQKEFGHFLLRMEEEGKLKPVKKSKFEEIVGAEGLLMEAGLTAELMRWFKGEKNRVDIILMLETYKRLFPDVSLPQKKKKRGSVRVSLDMEALAKEKSSVIDDIIGQLIADATIPKRVTNLEDVLLKIEQANARGAGEDEIEELFRELAVIQGASAVEIVEGLEQDEGEGEESENGEGSTRKSNESTVSKNEKKGDEIRQSRAASSTKKSKGEQR